MRAVNFGPNKTIPGVVIIDPVTGLPGAIGTVELSEAALAALETITVIPGTGATDLGKAEDAVHASGDVGVAAWGVATNGATTFGALGDYTPIALTAQGHVIIAPLGGADAATDASALVAAALKDAIAIARIPVGQPMLYNGATRDFQRGNIDVTLLASAARTATPTKVDQTNYNGRSLIVVIDVTAASATPSVVFTIQGKDVASGKYYTILASAAITGISTTVLRVSLNIAASANLIAQDIVPRTWSVDAVHGDADSITYSVGYSLVV